MKKLPAGRRERILAEADRLQAEHLTLQDLRRARQLTHDHLSRTLSVRKASIAKMEEHTDLMIATLRSHIELMGGSLNLIARFPDRDPVLLEGLGDIEDGRKQHEDRDAEEP
jgi:hypothetical protein